MPFFAIRKDIKMQVQSNRKDQISVNLNKKEADIMRLHAIDQLRSVSDTVRLIVGEYIKTHNLEEKYADSELLK